jgi:hypothetical protein
MLIKESKKIQQVRQNFETAYKLITKSKKEFNEAEKLLIGIKTNKMDIPRLYKQGELFFEPVNTLVYDEKLFLKCMNSLVETITGLSDICNPRLVGADKDILHARSDIV